MGPVMLMAALFGAVFALIGGVIGKSLGRALKLPERGAQIAMTVGAAAFVVLSRPALEVARGHGLAPRRQTPLERIDADLTAQPEFRAMKAYYPEDYAKITAAAKAKLDAGGREIDVANVVRSMLAQVLNRQLQLADDANTLAHLRLAGDEGQAAKAKSVDVCFQFAAGVTFDFDPSTTFPVELQKREQALSEAILKQSATAPAARPDASAEADLRSAIRSAGEGLSEADIAAVRKLSDRTQVKAMTEAEKEAVCRFNAAISEALLKLPPHRAAAAYKVMRARS
jgi:hypothetical protein